MHSAYPEDIYDNQILDWYTLGQFGVINISHLYRVPAFWKKQIPYVFRGACELLFCAASV